MDWTVFAKDLHMTLTLRLVTKHGRATPLLWQSVNSIGLKGHKNDYVFALFKRLRQIVPADTKVIVLGDREFGVLNNMKRLKEEHGFDYILRIKRNFTVFDAAKTKGKHACKWLRNGEVTTIENGYITFQKYPQNKETSRQELNPGHHN